jgi:eukaryotic-like serine/threonine-protein kinase
MTDELGNTRVKKDPLDDDSPHQGETVSLDETCQKIGKYPMLSKLGQGAMGQVWLSHNPDLDIPVAIKILPGHLVAMESSYVDRFVREARTAARINHSNVVRVYDCGTDNGVNYIVMEYVDGGNLRQLQEAHPGTLPLLQAMDIVIAVARALQEAAVFGIVHRDIKPDNIMLDKRGTAKLADLGLAKVLSRDDMEMTRTGVAMGSPKYIAPEQVADAKDVDARADIYSLGITFYHLVTGALPFSASLSHEMMCKHVEEPLPHPHTKNPDLPEDVCRIICKMTEKSPEQRYPSAEKLLVDLNAARMAQVSKDPRRTHALIGGRHRLIATIAGLVVLGVITFLAVALLGRVKESGQANKLGSHAKDTKDPVKPAQGAGAPVVGQAFKVPGVEIDLVPIASGQFRMGSKTGRADEKPEHWVRISSPFWMAVTETTRQQFSAFVEEARFRTDAERAGRTKTYEMRAGVLSWGWKPNVSWRDFGNHPKQVLVCISWQDAVAFCAWLTAKESAEGRLPEGYAYRLPTEAEWEYACRAGSTTPYYWGDDPEMYRIYEWCDNQATQANLVGEFKPNPWGLHDMLGNVMEHCLDSAKEGKANGRTVLTSDTYKDNVIDPVSMDGDQRICRGGNWLLARKTNLCSSRQAVFPEFSSVSVGFRIVLAPSIRLEPPTKPRLP